MGLCFELLPRGVRLRPLLRGLHSLDSHHGHYEAGGPPGGPASWHLPQLALLAHLASTEDSWEIMDLLSHLEPGWPGISEEPAVGGMHPAIRGVSP